MLIENLNENLHESQKHPNLAHLEESYSVFTKGHPHLLVAQRPNAAKILNSYMYWV